MDRRTIDKVRLVSRSFAGVIEANESSIPLIPIEEFSLIRHEENKRPLFDFARINVEPPLPCHNDNAMDSDEHCYCENQCYCVLFFCFLPIYYAFFYVFVWPIHAVFAVLWLVCERLVHLVGSRCRRKHAIITVRNPLSNTTTRSLFDGTIRTGAGSIRCSFDVPTEVFFALLPSTYANLVTIEGINANLAAYWLVEAAGRSLRAKQCVLKLTSPSDLRALADVLCGVTALRYVIVIAFDADCVSVRRNIRQFFTDFRLDADVLLTCRWHSVCDEWSSFR
ncbi:hypothetical protein AAVH_29526 [Aphelenchoides avenae]|nr:hypothetical protein AAVH_29526 [Aphelenchus avenae]